jgi:hypothetical protein
MSDPILLKPPYTTPVLSVEDTIESQSAVVDLGSLPLRISIQTNITDVTSSVKTFIDGVLASGTLEILDYTKLAEQAATGTATVVDYTKLTEETAEGTIVIDDYTLLTEEVATPSGTITFGTPDPGDTVVVDNGTIHTFTAVASDPGANEFETISELTTLIDDLTGLSASDNGTVITLVVDTAGTEPNDWTVTGTGTYSALSITFSGGQDAAVFTVGEETYVAGEDFVVDVSNNVTAANLEAVIDDVYTESSVTDDTITVVANVAGTAGNTIVLAYSGDVGGASISGDFLEGGQDHAVLTINSVPLIEGTDFDAETSNDVTASNLSIAVAGVTGIGSSDVASNVVTIRAADTPGTPGNSIPVATSDAVNLAISGAFLEGGVDAVSITIAEDTYTYVEGAPGAGEIKAETSEAVTATNTAAALDGNGVQASAVGAVVTILAPTVGEDGNSIVTTTDDLVDALELSGETLEGGLDSDVIGDPDFTITLASHGLNVGEKVHYDVVSGTTIDNLVDNTDYYVIVVDANTIQLAETKEDAIAGTFIEIADADDEIGGGEFTLTPATAAFDYNIEESNDNVNWSEVVDTSNTGTHTFYNALPEICSKYLRITLLPTGGELDVDILIHSKFGY